MVPIIDILGFSDSDFAGDEDNRNGAVSWSTHKQSTVTFCSMESEYMALSDIAHKVIAWKQFFHSNKLIKKEQNSLYCAIVTFYERMFFNEYAVLQRVSHYQSLVSIKFFSYLKHHLYLVFSFFPQKTLGMLHR